MINDPRFSSIRPAGPRPIEPRPDLKRPVGIPHGSQDSFETVLSNELAQQNIDVKFSAHAMTRMRMNRIELSPGQLQKIGDAMEKAEQKGAREALLVMDDMALVASVRNKTIITVVNGERMRENIFTKIDSAVIL